MANVLRASVLTERYRSRHRPLLRFRQICRNHRRLDLRLCREQAAKTVGASGWACWTCGQRR